MRQDKPRSPKHRVMYRKGQITMDGDKMGFNINGDPMSVDEFKKLPMFLTNVDKLECLKDL